jgi:hypothetical protein
MNAGRIHYHAAFENERHTVHNLRMTVGDEFSCLSPTARGFTVAAAPLQQLHRPLAPPPVTGPSTRHPSLHALQAMGTSTWFDHSSLMCLHVMLCGHVFCRLGWGADQYGCWRVVPMYKYWRSQNSLQLQFTVRTLGAWIEELPNEASYHETVGGRGQPGAALFSRCRRVVTTEWSCCTMRVCSFDATEGQHPAAPPSCSRCDRAPRRWCR